MTEPSVLVVVQRYGEVAGGAEAHARQLVGHLRPHLEVSVATTTARDYTTWENEFSEGLQDVDGVPVRRFRVLRRRARDLRRHERRVFWGRHNLVDEWQFIDAQGPYAPALLEYLAVSGNSFDHVLFFTYLYYPTVYGLPLVAERAVLVPTAHEEPPIRLTAYKRVFHAPRAIAYNSDEERAFVQARFHNQRVPNAVVGVGVDVPAEASADRFRQRHGLDGPLLLYVGRIGPSKGCDELFRYFTHWRDSHRTNRATLVLIGNAEVAVPRRDDIVHLGQVSDLEKFDAYLACDALVMPSRFESLSIVSLEAWACGRPVICHADCAMLRGMTRRAGGGLFYGSYAEFSEILELLLSDGALRDRLGGAGRDFVARTYTWPRVVETYLDLLAEVRARNS